VAPFVVLGVVMSLVYAVEELDTLAAHCLIFPPSERP
jgi:hypothetical protein